jgi:hypothetical protein
MSQTPILLQVSSHSPPADVDGLVVSHAYAGVLYVPGESGSFASASSNLARGDIEAARLPVLELADGKRVCPVAGKSLFKQPVPCLRYWASMKLEPVVKRGVSVHSKLTQNMFVRMCQGTATPEEILAECRSTTAAGKRNVVLESGVSDLSSSARPGAQLVTAAPQATPVTKCAPVLLQSVILQGTAIVLSAWKAARGEGGMSVQLAVTTLE